MATPLPKKLGLKAGMRAMLVDVPTEVRDALATPDLNLAATLTGQFDYIHVFTTSQTELADHFSRLKQHLLPTGMLWISWPKNRQLQTNLTLPSIIKIGYDHGLVESKTVSVDATWSAIKFTLPIPGKVYRNSFGTLKQ